MRKRNLASLLLPIAGVVIIFSAYCNTLKSPPVLDDFHTFVNQHQVHTNEISFSALMSLTKTQFGWTRIIPMVTFTLNQNLGKGDIRVFHLTNIFIHMLAFLGVCFLIQQLLELESRKKTFVSEIFTQHYAYLLAAIWALHPVNTNAVTYLVQRMASIQTLFYVLSVFFYIKGRRTHIGSQKWTKGLVCYMACAGTAVGALLSKENSAMLPVMLMLTEMWFFRTDLLSVILSRLRRCHWASLALLIIFGLLASSLVVGPLQGLLAGYHNRPFTLPQRLLTEARVVVWYMSLLIWPHPWRLSLDHDIDISTSLFHPPTTILSLVFLALLAFSTFRYRFRFPLLTYGVLWFLVNLIIESSILPLELVFEHRLYLPSIGFIISFICFVLATIRVVFSKASKRDFSVLTECSLAIVLSLLTLTTFVRNEAWESPLTLAYDSVLKAPDKPRPHANLAVALMRARLYDEAIKEAETAISLGGELQVNYAVSAQVIIGAYDETRQFELAIRKGEKFVSDFPVKSADGQALPNLCLNLSEAYLQSRMFDEAFHSTTRALEYVLRLQPQLDDFYYEKQAIRFAMERILTLARENNVDVKVDGNPDARRLSIPVLVAKEFLAKGDRGFAMVILEQAQSQTPKDPEISRMLAAMKQEDSQNFAQKQKWNYVTRYLHHPFSEYNSCMALAYIVQEKRLPRFFVRAGERLLDHALALRPDAADAHLLKGWYYYDRDEADKAVAEASRAIDFDPDYAQAWLGLGFFLAKANKPEEAISAFNKTFELYPAYPNRPAVLSLIGNLKDHMEHDEGPMKAISKQDSQSPPS